MDRRDLMEALAWSQDQVAALAQLPPTSPGSGALGNKRH